jgi:hypothetical protein
MVKYHLGSYYFQSAQLGGIFKVTPNLGTAVTEIEIVESMPEFGEELDSWDALTQSVIDNLKAFTDILAAGK